MASRSRQIAAVFARRWSRAAADSGFGLRGRAVRRESFARETRLAFEELGPAFIKLGQVMSVRPDVFSSELVFELSSLQDSVAPVPLRLKRTEALLQGRLLDEDSLTEARGLALTEIEPITDVRSTAEYRRHSC